ncbi:hypothetical protein EV361DRAFT_39670 [Lentinula raphanica]|nr:hypothetical protein EV361DRAFT_39670 [Lentinula raphanica]
MNHWEATAPPRTSAGQKRSDLHGSNHPSDPPVERVYSRTKRFRTHGTAANPGQSHPARIGVNHGYVNHGYVNQPWNFVPDFYVSSNAHLSSAPLPMTGERALEEDHNQNMGGEDEGRDDEMTSDCHSNENLEDSHMFNVKADHFEPEWSNPRQLGVSDDQDGSLPTSSVDWNPYMVNMGIEDLEYEGDIQNKPDWNAAPPQNVMNFPYEGVSDVQTRYSNDFNNYSEQENIVVDLYQATYPPMHGIAHVSEHSGFELESSFNDNLKNGTGSGRVTPSPVLDVAHAPPESDQATPRRGPLPVIPEVDATLEGSTANSYYTNKHSGISNDFSFVPSGIELPRVSHATVHQDRYPDHISSPAHDSHNIIPFDSSQDHLPRLADDFHGPPGSSSGNEETSIYDDEVDYALHPKGSSSANQQTFTFEDEVGYPLHPNGSHIPHSYSGDQTSHRFLTFCDTYGTASLHDREGQVNDRYEEDQQVTGEEFVEEVSNGDRSVRGNDTNLVGQKSKALHSSDESQEVIELPQAKRLKSTVKHRQLPSHRRHLRRPKTARSSHRDLSRTWNFVPELVPDAFSSAQPSVGWPWVHPFENDQAMHYGENDQAMHYDENDQYADQFMHYDENQQDMHYESPMRQRSRHEGFSNVYEGHQRDGDAIDHGLFHDSVDPSYLPQRYGYDGDKKEFKEGIPQMPTQPLKTSTPYPRSVIIEEVEDEESHLYYTKNNLGPHGHILRPITPVISTNSHSHSAPIPPSPPGEQHRYPDHQPAPSGCSGVQSTWNWDDDQCADPRTVNGSRYIEIDGTAIEDDSTKLNPPNPRDTSPLTEIPPTPGPTSSFANLQEELISLVETGVKTKAMKNHFLAQMNDADKAKLESLLDRCYRYLGVLNRPELSGSTSESSKEEHDNFASSESCGPKLYKAPKRKSEGRNDLAAQVRYETGVLLGSVDENGDTKDLITPSTKEISIFLRDGTGGPTLDNFRLQLQGKGKATKWNKAAAVIFSRHFLSKEAYKHYSQKKDKELIKKAFLTHIAQLQRDFNRQGRLRTIEERDEERLMRRINRRTGELQRLVSAFKKLYIHYKGPLGELARYFELITAECLSGDESGPESSDQTFYKTTVPWRSQELADFLNLLRAYHLSTRHIRQGRYDRGRFPHVRLPSKRPDTVIDTTRAPRKLPINWYDPEFLRDQDKEQLEALAPTEAVSLQLPDAARRTAKRFITVKRRGDIPLPIDHPTLD